MGNEEIHMKKCMVVLILMVFGVVGAVSDTLFDPVFADAGDQNRSLSVGFITYSDTGVSTPFSAYLADLLETYITGNTRFELVNQASRELVINELMIGLSGIGDERNRVGAITQIQLMLNGRFYQDGDRIVVNLEFLNMETSAIEKKARVEIPGKSLPSGLQIVPDNFAQAEGVLRELAAVDRNESGSLAIQAWTNKGSSGVFYEGELLSINFYANTDCYIKMYHISAEGRLSLIFPNDYHRDNFIKGRRLYTIPDGSYGFDFVMEAPYGAEFITVSASTAPFDANEEAFESLGPATSRTLTRGLKVSKKESLMAETRVSYTILAGNE